MVAVMLVLAAVDIAIWRLPHKLTMLLALLALTHAALTGTSVPLAILSGLIVTLPLWLLRRIARRRPQADRRGAIGGGDVRIAFAIGCMLGAPQGMLVIALASAMVALASLALHLTGRRVAAMPMGPFLAITVFAAMAWG